MATVQHSIEVKVPAKALYNQVTQFEDYPLFWENIEKAQQIDDTHVHWTAKIDSRSMTWDTEIIEQKVDHCIAWHDTQAPGNTGKVEIEPIDQFSSKVVFTLDTEPGQSTGLAVGGSQQELEQNLKQSLENLKVFVETLGSETGGWRGEVEDGHVTKQDHDTQAEPGSALSQLRQTERKHSAASDDGSPTTVLEDEPNEAGPAAFSNTTTATNTQLLNNRQGRDKR